MKICNINISELNKNKLFTDSAVLQLLIPLNAECIVRSNEDPQLLSIVNRNRTTIDGQIPLWIFQHKYPDTPIEKISGSDVIFDYCKWANNTGLRIFLLGGKETSNIKAIERLKENYPGIIIEGYSPPYEPYPFTNRNNDNILERITKFNPDIIFVGFGFGKQELWLNDNYVILNRIGVKWAICCGGTLEFISGEKKRAPLFIQKNGLEGIWRLLIEPKLFRLKRLIVSLKIFKYV